MHQFKTNQDWFLSLISIWKYAEFNMLHSWIRTISVPDFIIEDAVGRRIDVSQNDISANRLWNYEQHFQWNKMFAIEWINSIFFEVF